MDLGTGESFEYEGQEGCFCRAAETDMTRTRGAGEPELTTVSYN